jgi:hypothetical protein
MHILGDTRRDSLSLFTSYTLRMRFYKCYFEDPYFSPDNLLYVTYTMELPLGAPESTGTPQSHTV